MLTLSLHYIGVIVETDAVHILQSGVWHIQNQVWNFNKKHAMYTFNHYTC